MNRPAAWRAAADAGALACHMGVFELADASGTVVFVGFAGSRSRFGLKSEVAAALAGCADATAFRCEVTTAYLTRYQELLMRHRAEYGRLPAANPAMPGLGRLSPF